LVKRSRGEIRSTGYGTFVVGTAMGILTNLVTGQPEHWPAVLRPIATYSPELAVAAMAAVGGKAWYDRHHRWPPHRGWTGGNPYPGLEAFDQHRAGVFFGRSAEATELLDRVREAVTPAHRFVPVVGPSGSGKSSLVRAGLVPTLADSRQWLILDGWTPGADALSELAHALARTPPAVMASTLLESLRADLAALPSPPAGLLARLAELRDSRRVALIVDHLETTVTLTTEPERNGLLALLSAALQHDRRLVVIATLRSEWLGRLQEGPTAELFRRLVTVTAMTSDQLRSVISGPARLTGTTFDDGLVERMVSEAGGGDALPMLSYLLHDLYSKAPAAHITTALYEAAGGVDGAIARRASTITTELCLELGTDINDILDTLLQFVTMAGGAPSRRRMARATLKPEQQHIVDRFLAARLMTSDRDPDTGEPYVELTHEALLRQWQPLHDHVVVYREELDRRTELERQAGAWDRAGRPSDYLIRGNRLHQAMHWRDQPAPAAMPDQVSEFIDASRTAENAEIDHYADSASRCALDLRGRDPEAAIAVGLAAVTELADNPRSRYALYLSLATGLRHVLHLPHPVQGVYFFPDGRLATVSDERRACVWSASGEMLESVTTYLGVSRLSDAARDGRTANVRPDGTAVVRAPITQRLITLNGYRATVTDIAFSAGGDVATTTGDGTLGLWSPHGSEAGPVNATASCARALAYDSLGQLAVACGSTTAILTPTGQLAHTLTGHAGPVRAVSFTPDGRLATVSQDGTARLWSLHDQKSTVLTTRSAGLWDVAVATDGRLAVAAHDGSVTIWTDDGQLLHTLTGHAGPVRAVSFAPDGRLATASEDRTARIWPDPQPLNKLIETARSCAIRDLTPEERHQAMLPVKADHPLPARPSRRTMDGAEGRRGPRSSGLPQAVDRAAIGPAVSPGQSMR
jgi:hypothetical protein